MACEAVLFDFDGTLADTGPDLVGALNVLRAERGLAPVTMKEAGHVVGYGSRRMMRDFLVDDESQIESLRPRFLDEYDKIGHAETRLFDEIGAVLEGLEAAGLPWAIVTNKPAAQTADVLAALEMEGRAGMVVSSDTLPRYKPHPDGLLHVCEHFGLAPEQGVFVGDNSLDMEAAAACNMPFVAAGWGYWDLVDSGAEELAKPLELLEWVFSRRGSG